jgi:hypothetical protein
MAQVTESSITRERIDRLLDYLVGEWQAIPAIAAESSAWDDIDRLHFDLDWPVKEDYLATLRDWAEQGFLDRDQAARFRQLVALIDQHRPTLERLLAE